MSFSGSHTLSPVLLGLWPKHLRKRFKFPFPFNSSLKFTKRKTVKLLPGLCNELSVGLCLHEAYCNICVKISFKLPPPHKFYSWSLKVRHKILRVLGGPTLNPADGELISLIKSLMARSCTGEICWYNKVGLLRGAIRNQMQQSAINVAHRQKCET